ncbi:Zn-ribbon domain-containing OB-fold protein [Burkholderia sp. MR1-5-21]
MKLAVFRCVQCGEALFPARYFCPTCGGAAWESVEVERGTVCESTVLRHRVAGSGDAGVNIASVRTDRGPVVIAAMEYAPADGEAVSLAIDENARITAWATGTRRPETGEPDEH